MTPQLREGVRRLLVVIAVQGIVLAAVVFVAVAALVAIGHGSALVPRTLHVPLQPLRADASQSAAVEALRQAFPGDDVSVGEGQVRVAFRANAVDHAKARATLERHGFQASRFSIGRDIGMASITERLLTDVRAFAVMILALPLVLLVAGSALRARLRTQPLPVKSAVAIVMAGIAGGFALAIAVELLGRLVGALGYPIVEQPWIETMTRSAGATPLAIFIVVGVLVAPLGEEMFYRGWIFPYLGGVSTPLAYAASTLLFGAMHLHPPALPAYLLLGAGFAVLYRWSGSVWTPVLAHATNNALALAFLLAR